MYFLTQMKTKTDDSIEKGTSNYEDFNEAVIQFHTAFASAMQKEDTKKFVGVILDDNGTVVKREVYNKPIPPEPEEVTE